MNLTSTLPSSFQLSHITDQMLSSALESVGHHWCSDRQTTAAMIDLSALKGFLQNFDRKAWQHILLSTGEQEIFKSFSLEKRYTEWLGGRIAAKYALDMLCNNTHLQQPKWSSYSILPDQIGRPVLTPQAELPFSVSISHSHRYGAAMVSTHCSCGVDIQYLDEKLHRLQDKFSTPEERYVTAAVTDTLISLALIWTAKEAIKKCILSDQPALFTCTQVLSIQAGCTDKDWTMTCTVQTESNCQEITVDLLQWEKYIIARCTGGNHA